MKKFNNPMDKFKNLEKQKGKNLTTEFGLDTTFSNVILPNSKFSFNTEPNLSVQAIALAKKRYENTQRQDEEPHYVFVLADSKNKNFYMGFAIDLLSAVLEHRSKKITQEAMYTRAFDKVNLVYFNLEPNYLSAYFACEELCELEGCGLEDIIKEFYPLNEDLFYYLLNFK